MFRGRVCRLWRRGYRSRRYGRRGCGSLARKTPIHPKYSIIIIIFIIIINIFIIHSILSLLSLLSLLTHYYYYNPIVNIKSRLLKTASTRRHLLLLIFTFSIVSLTSGAVNSSLLILRSFSASTLDRGNYIL